MRRRKARWSQFFVVFVRAPEGVLDDIRRDAAANLRAGFLIEAEVYSAEHARVINILADFLECRVVKHDTRNRRIRERNRVAAFAVESSAS
jgi:hypothetical protein